MTIADFGTFIAEHEKSTGRRPSFVTMNPVDILCIQAELVGNAAFSVEPNVFTQTPGEPFRAGMCMRLLGVDIVPDASAKGGGIGITVE